MNNSVALFCHGSTQCKLAKLSNKVADLLNVAIDANDRLPQCICRRFKCRLESLGSTVEDLESYLKGSHVYKIC